jgi:hypothetical protein
MCAPLLLPLRVQQVGVCLRAMRQLLLPDLVETDENARSQSGVLMRLGGLHSISLCPSPTFPQIPLHCLTLRWCSRMHPCWRHCGRRGCVIHWALAGHWLRKALAVPERITDGGLIQ